MSPCWRITERWLPQVQAMDPAEKWQAARFEGSALPQWWTVCLVGAAALVLVAAVLVCLMLLGCRRRRRAWLAFQHDARQRGVCQEEHAILTEVVARAAVRNPSAVFAMDVAFDRGASAYLLSQEFAALSPEDQLRGLELVQSLRDRMDFAQLGEAASSDIQSTRSLDEGTPLMVFRDNRGQSFKATVASSNAVSLAIQPAADLLCGPGEALRVQFGKDRYGMEFRTKVIRCSQGKIIVEHTDAMRPFDRRRFRRLPVRARARMAPFPFDEGWGQGGPRFNDASVLEIGGPGVMLESPLAVERGQRVLIQVDLGGGRVFWEVAVVRRLLPPASGLNVFAVELLAMAEEDMARLTEAAEQIAQAAQVAQPAQKQPAPKPPAPRTAGTPKAKALR